MCFGGVGEESSYDKGITLDTELLLYHITLVHVLYWWYRACMYLLIEPSVIIKGKMPVLVL